MDAQEIRLRCLEAAQAACKAPGTPSAQLVVEFAAKFEAFVIGKPSKAAKTEPAQ